MPKKHKQPTGHGQQLSLADVIDVRKWQEISDIFSEVTDIHLRTFDSECRQVSKPRKEPSLCSEIIRTPEQKRRFCGPCLPTFLGGKGIVDKNLSFTCEAGLCNFAAPLKAVNAKTWGYIVAGPVILVRRKPKETYAGLAEELNVSLDELWNAILEIKVISFHAIQSILKLLQEIAAYSIEAAYKKLMRKALGRPSLANSAKLRSLLDMLLDVVCELTSADIGSIMLLDKKRGELAITSSKGISEQIAKHARVALGSGISGTAAEQKETFLIDDNLQDNRIKPYLNRPQIGSSMVLPFKIENKISGVLNLGALKSSPVRFTPKNLSEVNRILDLTTETF